MSETRQSDFAFRTKSHEKRLPADWLLCHSEWPILKHCSRGEFVQFAFGHSSSVLHLVIRALLQHPDSDSAEFGHPLATCGHGSLTDQPITDKRSQAHDVSTQRSRQLCTSLAWLAVKTRKWSSRTTGSLQLHRRLPSGVSEEGSRNIALKDHC